MITDQLEFEFAVKMSKEYMDAYIKARYPDPDEFDDILDIDKF